jgi:hypothetical protein
VSLEDVGSACTPEPSALTGPSGAGGTGGLRERGAFGPGSRKRSGLAEVPFACGLAGHGHPGGATGAFGLLGTEDRIGPGHVPGAGPVCSVQVPGRVERLPR